MHKVRSIRLRLGVSQASLAKALQCTQSNVSFYEVGKQTIPPPVARRLIDYAASQGLALTFDHVYGNAPLDWPEYTPPSTGKPAEYTPPAAGTAQPQPKPRKPRSRTAINRAAARAQQAREAKHLQ